MWLFYCSVYFIVSHTNHTINYNVRVHSFVSITIYRLHTSPLTKIVFWWFSCIAFWGMCGIYFVSV